MSGVVRATRFNFSFHHFAAAATRCLAGRLLAVFTLWMLAGVAGRAAELPGARAGMVETGAPAFSITGTSSMGLLGHPVDLQMMPDGRMLVVGTQELAIGDGERWDVFRQEKDADIPLEAVAVDEDGKIYAGMPGGFAEVEFLPFGRWRLRPVAELPKDEEIDPGRVPIEVEAVGKHWFWHWRGGVLISWRPGQPAKVVARTSVPGRVFTLGDVLHLSDSTTGALLRWTDKEAFEPVPLPPEFFVERTITASLELGSGDTLAGTIRAGVKRLRDGDWSRGAEWGTLSGDQRINDLCTTDDGFVAIAVEGVGVMFADRAGQLVQALDRSLDHRLARVRRLIPGANGVLWMLLHEGIGRVAFPRSASLFEPLVTTGLAYAEPHRHDGRLWILSDGFAQRGVYDADDRLVRFEIDTPRSYVCSLTALDDDWVAGARDGFFLHEGTRGWRLIADGPSSPYLRSAPVGRDTWLYVAENETGWLRRSSDGAFQVERFPAPDLGHVYGILTGPDGTVWCELGFGRVARVEATLPRPTLRVFTAAEGLPPGWSQLFTVDGEVAVIVLGIVQVYDRNTGVFRADPSLLRRWPVLSRATGRPQLDATGRLWAGTARGVEINSPDSASQEVPLRMPGGIAPTHISAQSDGVMWLHTRSRLVRYDPRVKDGPDDVLKALITRAEVPETGRSWMPVGSTLPDLSADEDYLIVHFVSPGAHVRRSVTFEVMLEGDNASWVSTGTAGQTAFNRLAPGDYVFRVRPRIGTRVGNEARLSFRVLTPWYKTKVAYAAYAFGGVGIFGLLGWGVSRRSRVEKERLARLVAERTAELDASNRDLTREIAVSRQNAEALRNSEDRYRRLSENAADIIFRVRLEPDFAYDYISPAVTRITGHRPAEFYGDPEFAKKISEPANSDPISEIARSHVLPTGVHEVQWRTASGGLVTLEERLVPVTDRTGRLVAIEGIARDITSRKQAQNEIRMLSQAIEQSPVGVFIIDASGQIVFANTRMRALAAAVGAGVLSRDLRGLHVGALNAGALDTLWRAVDRGESWSGQLAMRAPDGAVVQLRLSLSPLRGADGAVRHYLGLQEDISEWVEDQERRRRLEAQLFQAQKLESVGTLAGGIAHDFNNILTGILGYTELAEMDAENSPALKGDLNEIRAAALRAKELVAQILTFSRRGESKLTVIDLSTTVAEALKLVRASTPATIKIERDLEPGLVRADATQVHQIVLNLCTNARHAIGGAAGAFTVSVKPVSVETTDTSAEPPLRPGQYHCLSVSDTGHGMDASTLANIFDPFFTTKKAGEGTGLGLSIVQGIVANHDGVLRVRSAPGEGSTFSIYFPAAQEAATVESRQPVVPRGGQRHVLVVDDEPAVAKFVATRLEQFDYRVTVFQDPRLALAATQDGTSRFDVLVTDLTMPYLTGVELIQQIRAAGSDLPAVVVSGFAKEISSISQVLARIRVVRKPFTGEELALAVAEVLSAVPDPAPARA